MTSAEVCARLRAQVAAMGAEFDHVVLEKTRSLYSPLVKAQPTEGTHVAWDVPYGVHDRHRLDIYHGDTRHASVVLFVPGGGFIDGEKSGALGFYSNVGVYLARRGFTCAVMNYRLAPVHRWPAGSEDVSSATAWLRENASAYGADGSKLILCGHSAGAAHVSGYLFHPYWRHVCRGLAGALLLSGPYDFDRAIAETSSPTRENILAYVGGEADRYCQMSPLTHAGGTVPLAVGLAQFDPPFLAQSAYDLASALTRCLRRSPDFLWAPDHNHVSIVQSIGSSHDDFGSMLVRQLRRFA